MGKKIDYNWCRGCHRYVSGQGGCQEAECRMKRPYSRTGRTTVVGSISELETHTKTEFFYGSVGGELDRFYKDFRLEDNYE